MEGVNTIRMCQTQMIKAMDVYLKQHMLKDTCFEVKSVKSKDGLHFEIILHGAVADSTK